MNELNDKPTCMAEIASLLDEAINELAPDDRQAILLRFYEQRDLRAVGEAMRTSENAAQKRVSRALDQLHVILSRRGVTFSATALGTVLASEVVTAAPVGLAGAVTAAAIAETASLGGLASLGVITMTKANILLIGGFIAASALTPIWLQHRTNTRLRRENEVLRVQVADNSRSLASNLANPDVEELNQSRRQQDELLRLRAQVGSLRRALATSATAQTNNSVVSKESSQVNPVTEQEVMDFLQRPIAEQAKLLAAIRIQPGGEGGAHSRELAEKVRSKLEDLERRPADFAEFQSSFIEATAKIEDPTKLSQIRAIIQATYEQANAVGLDAPSRPQEGAEPWATQRDALDRRATRAVQELLTKEERDRFDRLFIGIMGIDLGIGDGKWHRFSDDAGTVYFPSETIEPDNPPQSEMPPNPIAKPR
jgi:hypothetical protein